MEKWQELLPSWSQKRTENLKHKSKERTKQETKMVKSMWPGLLKFLFFPIQFKRDLKVNIDFNELIL